MAVTVLLIEDNQGHAALVQQAFKKYNGMIDFHQVSSGESAFAWLESKQANVILLDLNLPGLYGVDVLRQLKAHPVWRSIPVIILTTSQVETDIIESYDAGAACYIIKPVNYQKWSDAISYISGLYKLAAQVR